MPDEPAVPDADTPCCGALMACIPGEEIQIPIPLKHTDVQGYISAYIATVDVTQQYHNPYDEKIEAVYVFPLPQNAAVSEFLMTIGERRIRGIIRERQEAEEIYHEARRQGHVASLLTQERENVFTQKVANIEPGKRIDINIKYFHTLAYDDGWYEWGFPMVVGPRFNPPVGQAPPHNVAQAILPVNDGVGAVPRGAHGASGQKTEVQYLSPDERSGHDISLAVAIDAGVEIEEIKCSSHVISVSHSLTSMAQVRLSERETIPNKDFVLRYRVAGEDIKPALLTHQAEEGGYFALMLVPPAEFAALDRRPMELVFVLDCSGSMNGQPIAQAKAAVERALQQLEPDDTFQIIRFSNSASQLGATPIQATAANIRRGLRYLTELDGEGGTMMIEGIKTALDFPHDPSRLRFITFLTDGLIGNESEILGEVHGRLGASSIFSFGVGSAPNRYLLDRMAKLGRGAVAYLSLDDSAADVMDRFFERASRPAMTDLSIDWGGMAVSEVFPNRPPDLFVGRPVTLTGRFEGEPAEEIHITGRVGDETRELRLVVTKYQDGEHQTPLGQHGNQHALLASQGENRSVLAQHTGHRRAAGTNGDEEVAAGQDEGPLDRLGLTPSHAALPAVWARGKIADLADRGTYEGSGELDGEIRQIALEYGLMSQFTAFVAVDSLTRTAGDHGTTVAVPVPVPKGVKYETTVSGGG